jgi:Arc/MetJ-type ribon-helix-helix transcriptional regulator
MPKVEVEIPDHIEVDIDRMVQEGEFLTREDAVEELLTAGISAYTASLGSGDDDEFGIGDEVRNPGSDARVDDRFDP